MEGIISAEQLSDRLLVSNGIDSRMALQHDTPIAVGRLSFIPLSEAVQLHLCRYVEQQKASNAALLSPSLNITVLLKGCVEFRVGNKFYHFDASQCPIAFANIIAVAEPFTRYLRNQQEIEKVTVSVSLPWFVDRFGNEDGQLLTTSKVIELPVTDETLEQTQHLLTTSNTLSKIQKLQCEGLAMQWLSALIQPMLSDNPSSQASYRLPPQEDVEVKKLKVVALLEAGHTVEDVAQQLAMSLSSLLRFFKTHFNATPKQYIKQHTLFKARHALLVDGLSIGEAAYLARYDHVGNFIAAFKKQFGVTPMQFIKQHRPF
ncbi:helix-turn-helix domain-containing protein [Pseudoalteromonas xiamenensis]